MDNQTKLGWGIRRKILLGAGMIVSTFILCSQAFQWGLSAAWTMEQLGSIILILCSVSALAVGAGVGFLLVRFWGDSGTHRPLEVQVSLPHKSKEKASRYRDNLNRKLPPAS